MAKQNFRQAKRQKEEARKARQLQKQQRRSDRTTGGEPDPAAEDAVAPAEPQTDAAEAQTP